MEEGKKQVLSRIWTRLLRVATTPLRMNTWFVESLKYNAFADTTPRSRTQHLSLCFLISISAVILKLMLKITSISPRDLGESLRRRRRSAFIYHTFIHTHNLLHYYKVGDQASVEVEGVEEQMLIFSSSLTPGQVKGSWIVLIWKIPACLW